ncbi:MAG: 5-formyltetrahydrofolate cyclo-ligase [Halioglobus sp.]|jgi:5-formyltetrahydrofolate cyclo-ligase|nr:5-formyltetrahydrofolate cyclo-ligase [Halioglobus sp.]
MTDSHSSKAALRRDLRQRRQDLDPAAQHAAAHALVRSVLTLPGWTQAQNIALYLARDGEIDTAALASAARDAAKHLFLPVIRADNSLVFARWDTDDLPVANRFHIPEPPSGAERCPAAELDIIFLPVVGWDIHGGRLGMGGGYYDRSLTGNRGPLLVGLAHECQQVEQIPRDSWDISLDYIATDSALHCCSGG